MNANKTKQPSSRVKNKKQAQRIVPNTWMKSRANEMDKQSRQTLTFADAHRALFARRKLNVQ